MRNSMRWSGGISELRSSHTALNLDGTGDGVYDTAEFSENTVPSGVGDVAAMRLDRGIQDFASVGPQTGERTYLVGAH